MTKIKIDTDVELIGLVPRPFTGCNRMFSTIWFDAIGNKDEPDKVVVGINLGWVQVGTVRQIARNKGYPCKGYVWHNAIECESTAYATQDEVFYNAVWGTCRILPTSLDLAWLSRRQLTLEEKYEKVWQIKLGFCPVGYVQKSRLSEWYRSYLGFDAINLEYPSLYEMVTGLNLYAIKFFSEEVAARKVRKRKGAYDKTWEHLVDYWLNNEGEK
jgi:hypothetical protein